MSDEARGGVDLGLLVGLSQGGFAERLDPVERQAIHISDPLDDYLENSLENGLQVILTGNPGDGKTQYILQLAERFPEPDYFYLPDASEWDYEALLQTWQDALDEGLPGILAINDGPLYAMISHYREKYAFLNEIEDQFVNQTTLLGEGTPWKGRERFRVIDLNNRSILTPAIIDQILDTLTSGPVANPGTHDHAGMCQVLYNVHALGSPPVRERLHRILLEVRMLGEHVTIRDLLNMVAYSITGDTDQCVPGPPEELKFYNLMFEGEGALFDLVRRTADPRHLPCPFLDAKLWTEVLEERMLSVHGDNDEGNRDISQRFITEKRRLLLGDREDQEADLDKMFQSISRPWHQLLNFGNELEDEKLNLIDRINRYFSPDTDSRKQLRIWISHNFRSHDSQILVSRTEVPWKELSLAVPTVHPEIEDAVETDPKYVDLRLVENPKVRLRISQAFYRALGSSDIPYLVRDRRHERRILDFMERVESVVGHQSGDYIRLQRTDGPGRLRLEVNDGSYTIR